MPRTHPGPTLATALSLFKPRVALATALVGAFIPCSSAEPIRYLGAFGDEDRQLTSTGFLLGNSFPDSGRGGPWGRVAWVASPDGSWRPVGLYEGVHIRDSGYTYNLEVEINTHGVSIGGASIFAPSGAQIGKSAWVANAAGTTLRLGFYDAEHTAPDGRTWHQPTHLNEVNQVTGYSEGTRDHRTGWVAGPYTPLTRLGLFDALHTSTDGAHWSTPVSVNRAGFIIGASRYYNGRDARTFGHTTWLYTPWKTYRWVGFQSGIHRTSTGWWGGEVEFLTNSGHLAGSSLRFRNDARHGRTAWLTHVAGPNRPVGFYDGVHTAPNRVAFSRVQDLNENGTAAGESFQFAGADPLENDSVGRTAWLARPSGETIRVGLYDAAHTRNGHQSNHILGLNENDVAVGEADRYDPATGRSDSGAGGRSAWLATPEGTMRLGLTDAAHTRHDGYQVSFVDGLTASRFAWGTSRRFDGGRVSSWVYDRTADSYLVIGAIAGAPAGFVGADIADVSEDGTVVGWYTDPDVDARRAFILRPGRGVARLMDVDTSPDAILERAWQITPTGYIVGEEDAPGPYQTRVFLVKIE